MALIACPDCSCEISDTAPACIHCGRPMPDEAPAPREAAPLSGRGKAVIALSAVAILGMCIAGARDDAPAGSVHVTSASTVEQKLAAIDGGSPSLQPGSEVAYRLALDALAPKCTEGRSQLGDMAVKTQQLAEEMGGPRPSTLRLLQDVSESIPPGAPPMPCAELFALLLTLS